MSFPTPIERVFIIVLENAEITTVLNNGPFQKQLSQQYGFAQNYYATCHPSAPNYLAMTSGATFQCGSNSLNTYSTVNITDLVESAGLTWVAYMESMPSPCSRNSSGNYVVRHNPFVYYADIINGSNSRCARHVLPLSSFDPNVTPPNYVFVTPNLKNDGHDTSVAYADNWLKGFLSNLLSKPWAQKTAFFILYDEGSTNKGYNGLTGGHTYFCAVSPISKNRTVIDNTSHYNQLTTVEWLLDLKIGGCGHNDNPTVYPPMKDLFQTGPSPLSALLKINPSTILVGQPVTFTVMTSGGTPPYTYSWTGLPSPCVGSNTDTIVCNPDTAGFYNVSVTVKDAANSTVVANGTLTVNSPSGSIDVTSPTTGIIYKVGEPRVVRWTHTDGTGANVKIELLKAGVLVKTISSNTPNDDTFAWTVPAVPQGNDYQVKVTSVVNVQIFGISGKFTI